MHLVIFYDVTSDKIRRKISRSCEDYGLDRTQFSAYVGVLSRAQQKELMKKLRDFLKEEAGALLLIPVSAEEWQRRIEYRQQAPGDGISTHPSSIADPEEYDGSLY
jgi:CRISPR-associated protein Cas2